MPRDRAPAHSFLSTCSTLSGPSISLCSSTHPLSTFCAPPPPLAGGEGVDSRTQRVETTRPGAAPRRVASCRTVCSTPRLSASGTSSSPRPTRPSSDSTSHAASAASPSTASDPAQRAPPRRALDRHTRSRLPGTAAWRSARVGRRTNSGGLARAHPPQPPHGALETLPRRVEALLPASRPAVEVAPRVVVRPAHAHCHDCGLRGPGSRSLTGSHPAMCRFPDTTLGGAALVPRVHVYSAAMPRAPHVIARTRWAKRRSTTAAIRSADCIFYVHMHRPIAMLRAESCWLLRHAIRCLPNTALCATQFTPAPQIYVARTPVPSTSLHASTGIRLSK